MADVSTRIGPRATSAAASAGWVLALLTGFAPLAEEHSVVPSSYYLTVRLVESHLPKENKALPEKLRQVFSSEHRTGTLQIEVDVRGDNTTTIAHAFELKKDSLIDRVLGRHTSGQEVTDLRDYEIISRQKIYQDDIVNLRLIYSGTLHDIATVRKFLNDAKGNFRIGRFTYTGLASQALRTLTRSAHTTIEVFRGPNAASMYTVDCIILSPNLSEPPRCEGDDADIDFAYVKLDFDVSRSLFS